jgi:prolyl-tRNA editing enzyme YbaK/EbsC (Cys-tRNA(Pro) deacylase)
VPPLAHDRPLRTLLDQALFGYDEIWAAAGTPKSVFPISPKELARVTAGEIVALAVVD